MNFKKYITGVVIVVTSFVVVSCASRGNDPGVEYASQMYHSVPYEGLSQITDKEAGRWLTSREVGDGEFYTSNPNNPNNMNMRESAPNTVRRGQPLPYRIHKDSMALAGTILKNPLDSTAQIVEAGKVFFGRYCLHCHGDTGLGDGLVGKVFKGVTPYNSIAVKNKLEGQIFHVITVGKGRMGAHASQVSVNDRWKIVRFVQTLQKQ